MVYEDKQEFLKILNLAREIYQLTKFWTLTPVSCLSNTAHRLLLTILTNDAALAADKWHRAAVDATKWQTNNKWHRAAVAPALAAVYQVDQQDQLWYSWPTKGGYDDC